jgi:hypothetical protein
VTRVRAADAGAGIPEEKWRVSTTPSGMRRLERALERTLKAVSSDIRVHGRALERAATAN